MIFRPISRRIVAQGLPAGIAAVLMAVAVLCVFTVAPTEQTMGDVQRILYIHVAVAFSALAGMCLMAGLGALYLWSHASKWDCWSAAIAELGWLASTMTLLTGSLWAHRAWGVWWTWDPRLSSMFVLWVLYSAYLLLRLEMKDAQIRGRVASLVSLVCVADVPLVWIATRWFRGIHPVAPRLDPTMRVTLWVTCSAVTLSLAVMAYYRQRQLALIEGNGSEPIPSVENRNLAKRPAG